MGDVREKVLDRKEKRRREGKLSPETPIYIREIRETRISRRGAKTQKSTRQPRGKGSQVIPNHHYTPNFENQSLFPT